VFNEFFVKSVPLVHMLLEVCCLYLLLGLLVFDGRPLHGLIVYFLYVSFARMLLLF